jgi:transcriptional regulator
VGDAPRDFLEANLANIVGIEIPVARMEGKWKMSQNRLPADRLGVVAGLADAADPHANARLAQCVQDRLPRE